MTLRAFQLEDFRRATFRPRVMTGVQEFGEELFERCLQVMKQSGPSFTLEVSEGIVFVGGVIILWPGRGQTWLLTTELVHTKPLLFHKSVARILDLVVGDYRLHRLEAAVAADWAEANKWIKRLGFTFEGLARKYTPGGRDAKLYARIH